nr:MAG TPA: hypothetical protein [Caudoviricetes sp.]
MSHCWRHLFFHCCVNGELLSGCRFTVMISSQRWHCVTFVCHGGFLYFCLLFVQL